MAVTDAPIGSAVATVPGRIRKRCRPTSSANLIGQCNRPTSPADIIKPHQTFCRVFFCERGRERISTTYCCHTQVDPSGGPSQNAFPVANHHPLRETSLLAGNFSPSSRKFIPRSKEGKTLRSLQGHHDFRSSLMLFLSQYSYYLMIKGCQLPATGSSRRHHQPSLCARGWSTCFYVNL